MDRAAIIFDFDGTLTLPYLDFDAMKAEMGVVEGPILEAMEHMSPSARARAEQILARYELDAAQNAELYAGVPETLAALRERGHPLAILTRNTRSSVELVLGNFQLKVDALRTREDGAIKPSAEPVLALCRQLEADPRRSWMVGDYLFDILSGRQAGTRTVLMVGDKPLPEYANQADHVIRQLPELLAIVDCAE